MIDCVILAAGASSRFGSCKLLADYRGQPVVRYALDSAQSLSPEKIVLVTGAYHERIESYCNRIVIKNLQIAQAENWQLGMGHSLAWGVTQLKNDNPVLILLADQPEVTSEDLQHLCRVANANPSQIVCASFSDTFGVPAIFPAKFKSTLQGLEGDRGAKQFLIQQAGQVIQLPMASAAFDIDTVADLSEKNLPTAMHSIQSIRIRGSFYDHAHD